MQAKVRSGFFLQRAALVSWSIHMLRVLRVSMWP